MVIHAPPCLDKKITVKLVATKSLVSPMPLAPLGNTYAASRL
jgi:hypothetical protein